MYSQLVGGTKMYFRMVGGTRMYSRFVGGDGDAFPEGRKGLGCVT